MWQRFKPVVLLAVCTSAVLIGCSPSGSHLVFVTATPGGGNLPTGGGIAIPTAESLDPTTAPTPVFLPTPNPTRAAIINPAVDTTHVVQTGDTLSLIAQSYGVTVDALAAANGIANQNVLFPGQALIVPQGVQLTGPSFKIVPDSEIVRGPSVRGFDVASYLEGTNSYLSRYAEDIDGVLWTGADIVERVSLEQSINPRLMLALLEYETGWLSQPNITQEQALYPLNYRDRPTEIYGLYRQLDWGAKMLQIGYYGWRLEGLAATPLADGNRAQFDGTINAGTAAVQMLLAQTRQADQWVIAAGHTGFYATYVRLFGEPFQYAIEPLIPPDLVQPELGLPWAKDETWYYTGGPHGGWGGNVRAALDFVPSEEILGCDLPAEYARAVADGVIARSEYGIVVLDLDGDGFEGTGWTIFYLHLSSNGRAVKTGDAVRRGDALGLPGCEDGVSYSSHLHIGRRYNGEWISADCSGCLLTVPQPQFNMEGWLVTAFEREYDGALTRGDQYREACACRAPYNTFSPWDRQ